MTEIIRVTTEETGNIARAIREWTRRKIEENRLAVIIAEKMVFKAIHGGAMFAIFIVNSKPQKPETVTLISFADTSGEKEKVELREAFRLIINKVMEDGAVQTIKMEISAALEKIISAARVSGFLTRERIVQMECSRSDLVKRIREAKPLPTPRVIVNNGKDEKAGVEGIRKFKRKKISMTKMFILAILCRQGPKTQTEISTMLGVHQSNVSHHANELATLNLVSNDKMPGINKHIVALRLDELMKLDSDIIQQIKSLDLNGKEIKTPLNEKSVVMDDGNNGKFVDNGLPVISSKPPNSLEIKRETVFPKTAGIKTDGQKIVTPETPPDMTPVEKPPEIETKPQITQKIILIETRNLSRGEALLKKKIRPENIARAKIEIITRIIERKTIKIADIFAICGNMVSSPENLVPLLCKEINNDAVEILIYNLEISNGCLKINQDFDDNDLELLRIIGEETAAAFAEKLKIVTEEKEPTKKVILAI